MPLDFYVAYDNGKVHHTLGVFLPSGSAPSDFIRKGNTVRVIEFDPSISGQERPCDHLRELDDIVRYDLILTQIPENIVDQLNTLDVGKYAVHTNNCRHFLAFVFRFIQLQMKEDTTNNWDEARHHLKCLLLEARQSTEQKYGGVGMIAGGFAVLAGAPLIAVAGTVIGVTLAARYLMTNSDHLDAIFNLESVPTVVIER
jgi:hypothetical protein